MYSLPSGCESIIVGGVTYQRCGDTWYQPRYQGNQTVYVVVSPP